MFDFDLKKVKFSDTEIELFIQKLNNFIFKMTKNSGQLRHSVEFD